MTDSDRLDAPASAGSALRRRELADFLRSRRSALRPEAHGFTTGPRRRAAGLRREEMAVLLGVSPSWYTKLEQGLDITTSPRLLARLAEVLLLSPVERVQLLRLGLVDPGIAMSPAADVVLPEVQMIIDTMVFSPAFVLTPRADYICGNLAARALFGEIGQFRGTGNQLLSLFLDAEVRRSLPDWDESARQLVALFRAAYARNVHDPRFQQLVDTLLDQSAEFRRIWARYELPKGSSRRIEYRSRDGARLAFHYFTFSADLDGHFRVEVYRPLDAVTHGHMVDLVDALGGGAATPPDN